MKFEHSAYQKPLSMTGLGGGATSLGFGSVGADKGWYLYHGCDDVNSGGSGIYQQNSDYGRNVRLDGSGNIYLQHHSGYRMNFSKFDTNFLISNFLFFISIIKYIILCPGPCQVIFPPLPELYNGILFI